MPESRGPHSPDRHTRQYRRNSTEKRSGDHGRPDRDDNRYHGDYSHGSSREPYGEEEYYYDRRDRRDRHDRRDRDHDDRRSHPDRDRRGSGREYHGSRHDRHDRRDRRDRRETGKAQEVLVSYGIHPVEEALEQDRVVRLLVTSQAPSELIAKAHRKGITEERVPSRELDRMTGGAVHQGVVAMVTGYEHKRWEEWYPTLTSDDVVLVLDRITDPRNLGAIARSAYLLGVRGIVIPLKGSAPVSAAAMKASAGALQHIPVIRHFSLGKALDELKDKGFTVVAADGSGTPISSLDIKRPLAVVIGAEGRGIRPSLMQRADVVGAIPMVPDHIGSFNASVAASILLYELTRPGRDSSDE